MLWSNFFCYILEFSSDTPLLTQSHIIIINCLCLLFLYIAPCDHHSPLCLSRKRKFENDIFNNKRSFLPYTELIFQRSSITTNLKTNFSVDDFASIQVFMSYNMEQLRASSEAAPRGELGRTYPPAFSRIILIVLTNFSRKCLRSV